MDIGGWVAADECIKPVDQPDPIHFEFVELVGLEDLMVGAGRCVAVEGDPALLDSGLVVVDDLQHMESSAPSHRVTSEAA